MTLLLFAWKRMDAMVFRKRVPLREEEDDGSFVEERWEVVVYTYLLRIFRNRRMPDQRQRA